MTPDGRFAFVTYQTTNHVGVFNLQRAFTSGFGPADLVGLIPVPPQPIGIALSPDRPLRLRDQRRPGDVLHRAGG